MKHDDILSLGILVGMATRPCKFCLSIYCRFRNFRENFIFANSIKRHISDVKNSQLRQDLPISIKDRVILPFREGFIFTKLGKWEVSRK